MTVTSSKWSYKPYKWPYKCATVTGVITPVSRVITLLVSDDGAQVCGNRKKKDPKLLSTWVICTVFLSTHKVDFRQFLAFSRTQSEISKPYRFSILGGYNGVRNHAFFWILLSLVTTLVIHQLLTEGFLHGRTTFLQTRLRTLLLVACPGVAGEAQWFRSYLEDHPN